MAEKHVGAGVDGWRQLKKISPRDVLPSVCDFSLPDNQRTKRSAQAYGKVPSLITHVSGRDEPVGFVGWSTHVTTDKEIEEWESDGRLGAGLIARHVRAIDIDIEDKALAHEITEMCEDAIGYWMPRRYRDNSGKCLITYILEHDEPIAKRVIKIEGKGIVEFHFNNQFFMCFGMHKSGSRYKWTRELEQSPDMTLEDIERIFNTVSSKFGDGRTWEDAGVSLSTTKLEKPRSDRDIDRADPILQFLNDKGLVQGVMRNGALQVKCPFEHASGEYEAGSTVIFPQGVGGFAHTGFKCLHSSCEHKNITDYLEAVGYLTSVEEEIKPIVVVEGDPDSDNFNALLEEIKSQYSSNRGILMPANGAVGKLLHDARSPVRFCKDSFTQLLLFSECKAPWRPYTDADMYTVMCFFERLKMTPVPPSERVRVAYNAAPVIDTAKAWINSLKWDGVDRISTFAETVWRVEPSEYHNAVARYLFTAMAGRVIEAGVKADMVVVLVSKKEGMYKTTFVRTLPPKPEMYSVVNLDDDPANIARLMQGSMAIELDELKGLRSREAEAIRSLVTTTHDMWVPKWSEIKTSVPRRCVFIGTTNETRFLEAGRTNRRWLPIVINKKINIEYLEKNRDQLFAQAAEEFKKKGVFYRKPDELAEPHRLDATVMDIWTPRVQQYIAQLTPTEAACLSLDTLFVGAIGKSIGYMTQGDAYRIKTILSILGYESNDNGDWTKGEHK